MRFSIATVLAFAASAMAVGSDPTAGFDQINTPNENEKIPAGKPYTVEWDVQSAEYKDGQIYIQLLGGSSPSTLQVVTDKLATLNNNAGSYVWNVDSTLGDANYYGLRFVWEQNDNVIQYSKKFSIAKAEGSSSESGSSTVTKTSAQGVKTITLSSTSSTTTAATTTTESSSSSTSSPVSTSSTHTSTVVVTNSTAPATSNTASMTTSLAPTSSGAATSPSGSSTATSKPTSGAARSLGSVAVFGALVAALLTL